MLMYEKIIISIWVIKGKHYPPSTSFRVYTSKKLIKRREIERDERGGLVFPDYRHSDF